MLPGLAPNFPKGFTYATEVVSSDDERRLREEFRALPFSAFQFHGFVGKRRVVYFGWSYDFTAETMRPASEIPSFLLPLRERAAEVAGLVPTELQQVLVTEYQPGAAIGWHRDKPVFAEVVGVSLLAACTMRLRRRRANGWDRASVTLEPRSVYVLRGDAREHWEHSIPSVPELRYSVTFRRVRPESERRPRRTR
jgi:alkylated DNA repair dioxygenase AlkB